MKIDEAIAIVLDANPFQVTHPVGAPHSPAREQWEAEKEARAVLMRFSRFVRIDREEYTAREK